eukprot:TRINITY_DN827_c1_g1_i2.p1 TRINITY_DN827_c1_g1~~TRINITY_DN827_c1_g1_i2.p1  ORF type:complete len:576 (-),score=272.66 TRINITY_DN827_c1_g1_i2:29-1756(-)
MSSESQRIFQSLGRGIRFNSKNIPASTLNKFKGNNNKNQSNSDSNNNRDEDNKNGTDKKGKKSKGKEEKREENESEEEEESRELNESEEEDNEINQKEEESDQNSEGEEEEEEEERKKKKEMKEKERINQMRGKNKIKVEGNDVPDPIEHFSELESKYNVKRTMVTAIEKCGYEEPTPIQMQVSTCMIQEREVLGIAPTGSGKTMSFAVPILSNLKAPAKAGFRAVIVSPTRELAAQIQREFVRLAQNTNQKGWKICLLTKSTASGNSFGEDSAQKFDILITTPMRLVRLVNEENVKLNGVQWLIFDEADRLFDEEFLQQIDNIIAACSSPSLKVCLFSATMLPSIENIAKTIQKDPIKITIGKRNTATETIDQRLIYVGSEDGKIIAIRNLIQEGKLVPPTLIFVQSKERAQQLFRELVYDGVNVDMIHSERTQAQRDKTVEKFRTGDIWVLITTELMARGMDFKNVNMVINFDFPQSVTTYIHRIGRTGRAGKRGTAITFYAEEDFPLLKMIGNVMKESGCENVPDFIATMKTPKQSLKNKYKVHPQKRKNVEHFYPDKRNIKKQVNKMTKQS